MQQWQHVAIGAGAGMRPGRFSDSTMILALIQAGDLDVISAGYIGGANLVGFLTGAAFSTLAAKALRMDRLLIGVALAALVALTAASALHLGTLWLGGWRVVIAQCRGSLKRRSL